MRHYSYLLGATMGAAIIAFGFGPFFGAVIGHVLFIVALICFVGALLLGYVFPSVLAGHFAHPRKDRIIALNLLLGWTLFGWIGAVIWASWPNRAASR